MSQKQYLAQCMGSHVIEIPHDTELEDRAIASEAKGRIDAIFISCDECPDCTFEAKARREADFYKYGYDLNEYLT